MTTPKEALESARTEFGYLQFHDEKPKDSVVNKVDAAIPVAELHEEAVELLRDSLPSIESDTDWWCPHCKSWVSGETVTFEEIHEVCGTTLTEWQPDSEGYLKACNLFTKLKALKLEPLK